MVIMFKEETILKLKQLFIIIFNESADDSKEFSTFVNNYNPHPLRIKIEDFIITKESNLGQYTKIKTLDKLEAAHELDTFITNFIDNNYV